MNSECEASLYSNPNERKSISLWLYIYVSCFNKFLYRFKYLNYENIEEPLPDLPKNQIKQILFWKLMIFFKHVQSLKSYTFN